MIPLNFFALYFPSQYQWFFSLFVTFSHLRNKKTAFRVTIPQGQHHVSFAQQSWALFDGVRTWIGDQIQTPGIVITYFFFLPFLRWYNYKTVEIRALCDVISFISQLFFLHFAMSALACIYLQLHINKQILLHSLDFWSSKTIFSILLLFSSVKWYYDQIFSILIFSVYHIEFQERIKTLFTVYKYLH